MNITVEQINALRFEVKNRLSKKRYIHTLGVEKMAAFIGEKIMSDEVDKLRVAALLHDISKEYSEAEYFDILKKHNIKLADEDLATPALWHSLTASAVVCDEFPLYADKDVLSAVYNHTVGSKDMSIFDEIILISDYIEEGRKYSACIDVRERLISDFSSCDTYDEYIYSLHKATLKALDNTIRELIGKGNVLHSRTVETRDAVLKEIERFENGNS